MTTQFRVHEKLPSGFSYANEFQVQEFADSGSVNGASKVLFVNDALAIRFRPPRTFDDIISPLGRTAVRPLVLEHGTVAARDEYVRQYNNGWQASKGESKAWDSGTTSHAWDDGYLDYAAGRPKWHLTYCVNHNECGEG
jgi:hypothetical protein